MHSVVYLTVFFLAVSLPGGKAQAQPYPKRTVYDFEDDTIDAEQHRNDYQLLIAVPNRLQAGPPKLAGRIALLNKKISEPNKSKATHAKLLWELAIAYAQERRNWLTRGYALYVKIDKASGDAKKALISRQKKAFRIANNCLRKANATYKALLCVPNSIECTASVLSKSLVHRDEALHLAVYSLRSADHLVEATTLSKRLLREYPNYTYASDMLLFLAEQADRAHDLPGAHALYKRALISGNREARSFALYRMAWIQHELGKDTLALEQLFSVVAMTRGQTKLRTLHRTAKRDFARFYAFIDKPGSAYAAFKLVDRTYTIPMMQLLGSKLVKQGKELDAMSIYRSLLRHAPGHASRCQWRVTLTSVAIANGRMDVSLRAFHELAIEVKATKANTGGSAKTIATCHERSSALLSEQAMLWHNDSSKTLNPHLLAAATQLYELFLNTFPAHKKVARIEYFYAEALWRSAEAEVDPTVANLRWQHAAEAFSKVVKRAKMSRAQQKESAYAAVLAWKNTRPFDHRRITISQSNIIQPRKIDWRQQKTIQAFDAYRSFVQDPDHDDDVVMMVYLKARIYLRHDQLDKALVLFENIVNANPSHETAPYAANLLLDSLSRLGRSAELKIWVDKLLANRDLLSGQEELKKQLLLLKKSLAIIPRTSQTSDLPGLGVYAAAPAK